MGFILINNSDMYWQFQSLLDKTDYSSAIFYMVLYWYHIWKTIQAFHHSSYITSSGWWLHQALPSRMRPLPGLDNPGKHTYKEYCISPWIMWSLTRDFTKASSSLCKLWGADWTKSHQSVEVENTHCISQLWSTYIVRMRPQHSSLRELRTSLRTLTYSI